MQRLVPPGRHERTRRDTKWAEDGLLCLLTWEGSAATTAWLRYRGQLSVGFGFKEPRAVCQSWEDTTEMEHLWNQQLWLHLMYLKIPIFPQTHILLYLYYIWTFFTNKHHVKYFSTLFSLFSLKATNHSTLLRFEWMIASRKTLAMISRHEKGLWTRLLTYRMAVGLT